MKKKILAYILTAVFLISVLPVQVFAENLLQKDYNYSVDLEGECNYDYAFEMFSYINEHRMELGLSELALDKELTDAAMKRALELAINFSHERPDGSSCFSICSKVNAENIAIGRNTPSATFEQFMNSSGHYAKMTSTIYRSVGIGAVYHNGHYYWVQLFSMSPTNMMETGEGMVPLKHNVKVAEDEVLLNLYVGNYLSSERAMQVPAGKSYQMSVERFNPGFVYFTANVSPSSFSWVSSDPDVISVDENGYMTAVGVGTATVTVSVIEGNITLNQSFIVPGSMSDVVAAEIPDVIFDGSEATPEPVLTLNGTTLVKDRDYTLSYSGNGEVGTATVTVTGIGYVNGEMELSFNIVAPDLSDETMTDITLPENVTYNGGEVMPEPVVTVCGKTLVKDVDYTLEYQSNSNVGTGYVIIRGLGIYSGTSKTVPFEIAPMELVQSSVNARINANAVFSEENYPDRMSFVQDNVSLVYKGTPLVCGEDYNIVYSSLTSEKKLSTLRIEFIGKYSGTVEYSTIVNAFIPEIKPCYYDGTEIVPEITVYKSENDKLYGGEPLVSGVDYYLNLEGNVYPGTAEVTVIGVGKYFGEATTQFTIRRIRKGDADRSGNINVRDLIAIQKHINGWDPDIDLYAADADNNDKINIKDLILIQKYINGWDVELEPKDDSSSQTDSGSENEADSGSGDDTGSDDDHRSDPDEAG